jgi:hypothetical protein
MFIAATIREKLMIALQPTRLDVINDFCGRRFDGRGGVMKMLTDKEGMVFDPSLRSPVTKGTKPSPVM